MNIQCIPNIHVRMYNYTCIYMYICIHVYTYVCTYIHVYLIYVCTCTCMYYTQREVHTCMTGECIAMCIVYTYMYIIIHVYVSVGDNLQTPSLSCCKPKVCDANTEKNFQFPDALKLCFRRLALPITDISNLPFSHNLE